MEILNKLKDKFMEIYQKDTTQDFIAIIPCLKDANEWVNDVAKYSNDIKLAEAWRCIAEDNDIEKSINQLYDYVSNEERAFFVSDSFKKIILCNSRISSSIIAYIMGEIVSNNRNFEHRDAVLYSALLQMTDYDIRNFKYLMENVVGRFKQDDGIIDETKINNNKESFEITMQICLSTGVFRTEHSVLAGENYYTGDFPKVTDIAYSLLKYIKNVSQLLNYNV